MACSHQLRCSSSRDGLDVVRFRRGVCQQWVERDYFVAMERWARRWRGVESGGAEGERDVFFCPVAGSS